MSKELFYSPKIVVRDSPLHGRGVFATEAIPKYEIIEQCHYVPIDIPIQQSGRLFHYCFAYPKEDPKSVPVVVLGNGMIYNHSDTPNANWITDEEHDCFTFFALRDIEPGEEICTNYGVVYTDVAKNW